jgi:hypothetical protein
MNIKIDRELCDRLLNNTKSKVLFGSEDGEDKDYLCILPPNIQMDCAFHNRDHFLFFKDEELKIDYLFATPRCLVNGIVTGSSTLLYELIINGKLNNSRYIEKLANFGGRQFITHRLAKSFLGIAKRDFKQSNIFNRKMFWVENYKDIITDMLDCYKIGYQDRSFIALSFAIKGLPKYSGLCYDLSNLFPKPIDIPELDGVESVFYKNWEDSL